MIKLILWDERAVFQGTDEADILDWPDSREHAQQIVDANGYGGALFSYVEREEDHQSILEDEKFLAFLQPRNKQRGF